MGYGWKWWMPEWYLAYSDGSIWGTLSLQAGPRWWEPLDHQIGPRCMWTIIEPVSRSQAVGTVGPLNWSPVYVDMWSTIRSYISSPSTSDNDPRLSDIWMYVSWDRYRDTYLDIWVRRVILIIIDTVMVIVMDLDVPGMFSSYVSSCDTCYDFRDSSDDSGFNYY